MATSYSQLAALAQDRSEPPAGPIALHLRDLTIRLRLGVLQAANNLRRLAPGGRELGNGAFGHLITQTGSDSELTRALGPLLDQVDKSDNVGTDPAR